MTSQKRPASPLPSDLAQAVAQGGAPPVAAASDDTSASAPATADHPPAEDGISLDTTIDIRVPPSEAFAFWRAMENFPRFMRHVHEVRREADGGYLWRVEGPVGTEVSWHAQVTALEPDRRIAWASDTGESVENRGEVHFAPNGGGTRLSVSITYAPPAGRLGHALATLLGVNPRQQMEEDLDRCRILLEAGAELPGEPTLAGAAARPGPDAETARG